MLLEWSDACIVLLRCGFMNRKGFYGFRLTRGSKDGSLFAGFLRSENGLHKVAGNQPLATGDAQGWNGWKPPRPNPKVIGEKLVNTKVVCGKEGFARLHTLWEMMMGVPHVKWKLVELILDKLFKRAFQQTNVLFSVLKQKLYVSEYP